MTKSGKRRRKRMKSVINNPVAKHAHRFNKAATHKDRKNDYTRKPKHRNKAED